MKNILKHLQAEITELHDFKEIGIIEDEIDFKLKLNDIDKLYDEISTLISSYEEMSSFSEVLVEEGLTDPIIKYAIGNGYDKLIAHQDNGLSDVFENHEYRKDVAVSLNNAITGAAKKTYEFIKNLIVKIAKMISDAIKGVYKFITGLFKSNEMEDKRHEDVEMQIQDAFEAAFTDMLKELNEDTNKTIDEVSKEASDIEEQQNKKDKISKVFLKYAEEVEAVKKAAVEQITAASNFELEDQNKQRFTGCEAGSISLMSQINNIIDATVLHEYDLKFYFLRNNKMRTTLLYLGYPNLIQGFVEKGMSITELFKYEKYPTIDKSARTTPRLWFNAIKDNFDTCANTTIELKNAIDRLTKRMSMFEKEEKELLKAQEAKIVESKLKYPDVRDPERSAVIYLEILSREITIRNKVCTMILKELARLSKVVVNLNKFLNKVIEMGYPKESDIPDIKKAKEEIKVIRRKKSK